MFVRRNAITETLEVAYAVDWQRSQVVCMLLQVAVIGVPNAGKSTLTNMLVGQKVLRPLVLHT